MAEYVAQIYWSEPVQPASWETACFSRAVYLYRETSSKHYFVVKYYSEKTGKNTKRYANRELNFIEQAQAAGLSGGKLRTLQTLGTWRGILFLEHVKGLTLGDTIAVRQSQPGSLLSALACPAELLERLHTGGSHPEVTSFEAAVKNAHKSINQLASSSLLASEPATVEGLHRLIEGWAQRTWDGAFHSYLDARRRYYNQLHLPGRWRCSRYQLGAAQNRRPGRRYLTPGVHDVGCLSYGMAGMKHLR